MLITVMGPHAVGKTTAIKRWSARFKDINFVHADNCIEFNSKGMRKKEKLWMGTSAEKVELAERCRDSDDIWVVEGNTPRNTPWLKCVESHAVIHVYTDPQIFKRFMQDRCAKRDKEFREDYWTDKKLEYESYNRFNNLRVKHWSGWNVDFKEFKIVDYNDWRKIDFHFIKLAYRYLNDYSS